MMRAYCWNCDDVREMQQVDDVLLCDACDTGAVQCAKCGHVFADSDEYEDSHLHADTKEFVCYCPTCCPTCNGEEVKR